MGTVREPALLFGGAELRTATQRRDELAVDAHLAAEEVDPIPGHAEALALPESHPGCEHDQGSVAVGDGGDHGLDLAHRQGDDLCVVALREGDPDTGRGSEDEKWSLTVTSGQGRTHKTAGQRLL